MKAYDTKLVRIAVAGLFFAALTVGGAADGQKPGMGTGAGSTGGSQQQGLPTMPSTAPNPRNAGQMPPMDLDSNDGLTNKMQEQQAKSRNTERQKKLALDTEKLLSLATELKEQVDKTDKNILSVDVIRKADEIEKLAKSVKDRMKG